MRKRLLLLPLLLLVLVSCKTPPTLEEQVVVLQEQVVVLQAQYRDLQDKAAGAVYYELTIGSFLSTHAYGAFSTYDAAVARVAWLKEHGYMGAADPFFIQSRRLNDPLTVLDTGVR